MYATWLRFVMATFVCLSIAACSQVTSFADESSSAESTEQAVKAASADKVEHGGHQDPPGTPPLLQFDAGSAIANIAIFIGVLAILSKLVWPVILDGLKARESKIRTDLESADKANREARSILASYQSKLDEAALKVQSMIAEARKDGELAGQRIVEDAKAEAERQRVRALADIETAKKVAISELASQTSDMAMSVARKVVGRELKADDHADLIRQSLDRLPSNN
jgi:F-type H+-transporting ATPase subunit b